MPFNDEHCYSVDKTFRLRMEYAHQSLDGWHPELNKKLKWEIGVCFYLSLFPGIHG